MQQNFASVLTDQPGLTPDERSLIARAYDRLDSWKMHCKEIHDRARESRKIMLLQDPKQDAADAERKTLQLQTLKSTINNCVADQMDNIPEVVLSPEQPELQSVAEDFTDVIRFVMDQNDYERIHRDRVWDYFVTGSAVTQVVWDPDMDAGKGNIALIRWPIEAFVWDPFAQDIQEGRGLFKVSWHPREWYDEHYPEQAKYIAESDDAHRDVGRPDAIEGVTDVSGGDLVMLMEYWYRKYNAKTRKYRVSVAYIAGGALLSHEEDMYKHGLYPFVVDAFTPIEGMPVGDGLVQELVPMMRYINRYARYIDENLAMSAKIRMLARRNANLDVEALANWDTNLITGDSIGEDAIRWLQSKPLNGMAPQQMIQFQTDIKQDSGQNQFTRGETAGGVTAFSAIAALQEAGSKITRMHIAKLNFGMKKMAEQIMWLVSQFYTEKKVRMIRGADGKPKQVDMSADHLMGGDALEPQNERDLAMLPPEMQEDARAFAVERQKKRKPKGEVLPPPPYTVQIQVQGRNPLRVQAQNEMFIQAYTMAAQAGQDFPLTLLFELLNVDGKDKIMPVLRQVDQRTQQIQALMAQAQQMTAENETLKKAIAQGGASMRKQPTQQRDLQGMTVPDASAAVGGVKQEQSA